MISVIITTYHRPNMIRRAVDSVLSQNNVVTEVIVIDDNEPNSKYREITSSELSSYSGTIKYVQLEKNVGACEARNVGMSLATFEFVKFLDDDDILKPNHLFDLHGG